MNSFVIYKCVLDLAVQLCSKTIKCHYYTPTVGNSYSYFFWNIHVNNQVQFAFCIKNHNRLFHIVVYSALGWWNVFHLFLLFTQSTVNNQLLQFTIRLFDKHPCLYKFFVFDQIRIKVQSKAITLITVLS